MSGPAICAQEIRILAAKSLRLLLGAKFIRSLIIVFDYEYGLDNHCELYWPGCHLTGAKNCHMTFNL